MRPTRLALAWDGFRVTTARERLAMAFALLVAAAVAAAAAFSGQRVGANVWRPGWICGETLKGAPVCMPDPKFGAGSR